MKVIDLYDYEHESDRDCRIKLDMVMPVGPTSRVKLLLGVARVVSIFGDSSNSDSRGLLRCEECGMLNSGYGRTCRNSTSRILENDLESRVISKQ